DLSEGLRVWISDTAESLGGLDCLIANASALGNKADEEAWRTSLEVDILGTVRAVEASLPYLENSEAASITAISSTVAVNIPGSVRAYNGAKAALINYVSGLSTTLGRNGIRANSVSPGAVYFEGGVWDKRKRETPKVYEATVRRSPMGRLCTPEEVANAVVFLASPAASFISGTNVIVDGGSTTRVQY
ncbi:MAG TPA: 3-ketoacyl-ACP reductase, partial [Rhodospirillaceae bacterium]|nr:3-ketoacyl-ACP reductase [Rhodospirillaceae bacterium]